MEQEMNQESIIWIALLYNYIANKETSLPFSDINSYIKEVNKNLKQMNSDWKVSEKENQNTLWNLSLYGIEKDDNHEKYDFVDMTELEWIYNSMSNDIIYASLQENALSTIYVNKSNLQLKKEYIKESSTKNIYSLEANSAIHSTREILEQDGCKNIRIISAIPDQLEGDKGYHVSYQCERPIEKVIILKK